VHRGTGEGHGDLGAGEVGQAQLEGRGHRPPLAAQLVMVGERPELDAVGLGTRRERFGRQGSVGDGGVGMQVGVEPVGI